LTFRRVLDEHAACFFLPRKSLGATLIKPTPKIGMSAFVLPASPLMAT
jgi:hypothetical protein